MNKTTPTRDNVIVLKQILNLIQRGMINRHARETGVEAKARTLDELGLGEACPPVSLPQATLSAQCTIRRINGRASQRMCVIGGSNQSKAGSVSPQTSATCCGASMPRRAGYCWVAAKMDAPSMISAAGGVI